MPTTSQPIALSDSELDAVMAAARPLAVEMRDPFLHAVAIALAGRMIGPGAVHQVCRELQAQFFDPPSFEDGGGRHVGKYADAGGPSTRARRRQTA